MHTSIAGIIGNTHDPLSAFGELAGEGAAVAAGIGRLERARLDRELILAPLEEPASPTPFVGMPSRVGTLITIDAMDVPSVGYGAAGSGAADATLDDDTEIEPDPAEAGSVDEDPPAGEGIAGQGIAALTASRITKRELAFLDDKSLTIEEKLFRFMVLLTKKSDQDLVAYMKEITGKSSSSSSSTGGSGSSTGSSSSGTGSSTDPTLPSEGSSPGGDAGSGSAPVTDTTPLLNLRPPYTGMSMQQLHDKFGFDGMVNVIQRGDPNAYAGFFSAFDNVAPAVADGLAWAAHEFAGPAAGAAVTAMGLPELAPVASAVGSKLGDMLGREVKSLVSEQEPRVTAGKVVASVQADTTAGASESGGIVGDVPTVAKATSSSSSSPSTSDTDERIQMMNLQRMVDKQNAMFTAVSNVLKSLHDTRMAVVQNLR